jgi:hypothetical protein
MQAMNSYVQRNGVRRSVAVLLIFGLMLVGIWDGKTGEGCAPKDFTQVSTHTGH